MTLNSRHIKKTSFTPSPTHAALKKAVKTVAVVLGAVVGLVLWAVLRPIARGIGWIISLLTAVAAILWLLTL